MLEKIDGEFGPLTGDGVKKFQKDNQLVEDGIFGAVTYHALHHAVKKLQWTLFSVGIDVGKIDGEFGPLTGNGVKEYQKRHQLKVVDGVFNTETQSSLVDTVKHIQRRLWFLGYHIGNLGADGVLGHLTHGGIIAFQKDHELKQDGEVGMVTWSKLNEMIKHIQFALKHLSFACDVTGDSDEKTQTATKAFQTAKKFKS